ncbi:MAG: hypothetical protein GY850_39200 [bacterium]|nr:hypothetical protein [bacterium]
MAIDSKANVCVVDGGNKRIQKFDATGKVLPTWPTYQADNSSISPCGIAIDQADNVYVINNYKSDIIDFPNISFESNDLVVQVFDGNGLLLDEWRSEGGEDHNIIRAPTGIGIDAQQRVYLVEIDLHMETMNILDIVNSQRRSFVTVYSQDGEELNRWGTLDFEDGYPEFFALFACLGSQNNVYALNLPGLKVHQYTGDGELLSEWGIGSLQWVTDMAVDRDDNIYIADMSQTVTKFTAEGKMTAKWNIAQKNRNNFGFGMAGAYYYLAVDGPGDVYVSDSINDYIYKYKHVETSGLLNNCAVETALDGEAGLVDRLRTFRDRVLKANSAGNTYVDLYYMHSPEVVRLLDEDRNLKRHCAALLKDALPVVNKVLAGKQALVSRKLLGRIDLLLGEFAQKGSPAFRAAIGDVRKELGEGALLRGMGVLVEGEE